MSTVSITQFSNGSIADANQVNADFNTIANVINGNLDDTNIASGANINGSKILASSIPMTAFVNQDGWIPSSETWTYGANNGNKEYTVTITGDKTGKYSPGMKVKLPRVTTPPTQAMSFTAASSQYASKTSPTGISFTAAYTTEIEAYPTSYTTGILIGKADSTNANGFQMFLDSSGRIVGAFFSGGNGKQVVSYQSVPLNRWSHIAVVWTSVSGATANIYLNGTLIPSTVSNWNTGGTVLTQAGTLFMGANGIGGTPGNFYNGYASEGRIWSVAQSQASIQANMNINLVGNETNLVALFQGNGTFADGTSNGNTLTATGGAIATQAANPYSATEYGVIATVTYGSPNTTLLIHTGENCNIPNQTLGSPSYSLMEQPYGLPAGLGNNRILAYIPLCTASPASATAVGAQPVLGLSWTGTIPTGRKIEIEFNCGVGMASSGGAGSTVVASICQGSAADANRIGQANSSTAGGASASTHLNAKVTDFAASGTQTFLATYAGTGALTETVNGATVAPAFLKISLVN